VGDVLKVDILTAEIGSTTTVVSLFDGIGTSKPRLIAQGEHFTTVSQGDVGIGIQRAVDYINKKLNKKVSWDKFIATSSAAGGLKMSVHGLVYEMTVKAAKEAALGAGGIIKSVTSGKISSNDIERVKKINPNIVLIAGGVDYGEKETVLHNSRLFSESDIDIPFVYAGNCSVRDEIKDIFESKGKKIRLTDNVYPRVDELNISPLRLLIQEIFSEHIINAKGMHEISEKVFLPIIPTPAAVMDTTQLLSDIFGDVLTVDIGGATTDIDSYTEGTPEIMEISVSPEPLSKRTVEGDLGVFVNARNVVSSMGQEIEMSFPDYDILLNQLTPYPENDRLEKFGIELAKFCLVDGLRRHAGRIRTLYGPMGRYKIAEGKDLTSIKYIFGTGGILSRSKYAFEVLNCSKNLSRIHINELLPKPDVKLMRDKNYIFAPIGLISKLDKDSAIKLLKDNIEEYGI